jgi:hypothetical protein
MTYIWVMLAEKCGRHNRKWTCKEDRKLVRALRRALDMKTCPVEELPLTGLPWSTVSVLMHGKRSDVECSSRYTQYMMVTIVVSLAHCCYCTSWTRSLRFSLIHGAAAEVDSADADPRILRALQTTEAEAEDEVNWYATTLVVLQFASHRQSLTLL